MATHAESGKAPTVIKKYANRRLYHTGTSSYVTLEDLAALVRNGEDFVVYDAKSGDDITRSVLAQIIFEEEAKTGTNLLPIAFLRQLIRFYGDSMQALVPRFLEMSMQNFAREQQTFRDQINKAFGTPGLETLEAQTRANLKLFTDALRMFAPFSVPMPPSPPATGEDGEPPSELDRLQREMAAMRETLDKLAARRNG
jgi:polyhydroxyalkanoate synthesis repressor PhaR